MDRQSMRAFFGWCSIINIGLFLISALMVLAAPDFVYDVQSQMFHLQRDSVEVVMYGFFGLYKILILVFNLVPYVALRVMDREAA